MLNNFPAVGPNYYEPIKGVRTSRLYVAQTFISGSERKRVVWIGKAPLLNHEMVATSMWRAVRIFEDEHKIDITCEGDSAEGGGWITFDLTNPKHLKITFGGESGSYGPDPDPTATGLALKEKFLKYEVSMPL